ncbi:MAG: hypothetical protein VKJ64_12250 [Leptolyngbyaceae bacterium]|nr:hypothetical protein [Leptolyngbyaceae bacterium]
MPNKFFEIAIDALDPPQDLEYKKYSEPEYGEMAQSLQQIQSLMDQGKSGQEILSTGDNNNLRGVSESYKQFYNPKSGDRVKVNFDENGQFHDYTNGRHRIEAARNLGLSHIPADVYSPTAEGLQKIENTHGSGRNLENFNPLQEQDDIDRAKYGLPPENKDPAIEQVHGELGTSPTDTSGNPTSQAQEPNLDKHVREQIEQGHGESGDSGNPRIRETDRPGDFTPELEDAMRQEYGSDSNPPEEAIDISEISEG